MKSVLISIHPEWCELIASGKKTLEVRKTMPKIPWPFKAYIYCTKNKKGWFHFGKKERLDGKVIGEFVCDSIRCFDVPYPAFRNEMSRSILEQSCLTYYQLHRYAYHDNLYGWHISDLKIYDKPKPLSEFYKECAGLDNTGMCYECEYAVGEECDCAVNGRLHLTRPPQSWCYVEELKDG